jgi:hypothetical protein
VTAGFCATAVADLRRQRVFFVAATKDLRQWRVFGFGCRRRNVDEDVDVDLGVEPICILQILRILDLGFRDFILELIDLIKELKILKLNRFDH